MKRYLSVLMIASRCTIYKLTALLVLTAAAETASFLFQLQRIPTAEGGLLLEDLLAQSRLPLLCGVAFLLLCALLCLTGCTFSGSKTQYTLRRLSLSERTITLLWAAHNAACLLIFWAAQLLVVLFLCHLYLQATDPAYWNEQTVFLTFYRSEFLHSLLPLAETSRWLRNAALLIGLALAASCFSLEQRRGRKGLAAIVLAALTFFTFSSKMGRLDSDISILLLAVGVCAYLLYGLIRQRPFYESENKNENETETEA